MSAMSTMGRGARGEPVRDVQTRLAVLGYVLEPEEHGEFGASTEDAVRAFQQRRRLRVDGLVGVDTWNELVEAGFTMGDRALYLRYPFLRGDDVRALQAHLNLLGFDAGREDGIFGERTGRAVLEFQRNVGMSGDGIAGRTTIHALRRLRPVGPGPGRATVREAEALRRMSGGLRGAVIAVDAGHGPGDPGAAGPGGVTEARASYLLAASLVAELRSREADPFLLRAGDANPPEGERARQANRLGAALLVSFHLNSHDDPRAFGASTYYYGTGDWSSGPGQRLADLILDRLTNDLGLADLRSHATSTPLLRETRMPAVEIEPCFLTNPDEEARLGQELFRRQVASAVADGIERFFGLPGGDPAPHGTASASSATASRE